jgi:hypothetical protein
MTPGAEQPAIQNSSDMTSTDSPGRVIRHGLDAPLAAKLGEILGQELADITICTGEGADALNRRLGAEAFACGREIFFRTGAYDPHSAAGLELLAHEAIHVCQQRAGRVVRSAWDACESEARALARPVAALLRGGAAAIPQASYVALHAFRARSARCMQNAWTRAIQCSAAAMITAANAPPPRANGPDDCHQAVLGWLLTADRRVSPWKLMTYVQSRKDVGTWLTEHIYRNSLRILPDNAQQAAPGDILFLRVDGLRAAHSMVVVRRSPTGVFIRGFNNGGTFNHRGCRDRAPDGAYDPTDRDICTAELWYGDFFGAASFLAGELHCVPYEVARHNVRNALRHWTHSYWAGRGHHGWEHRGAASPCDLPACPNCRGARRPSEISSSR